MKSNLCQLHEWVGGNYGAFHLRHSKWHPLSMQINLNDIVNSDALRLIRQEHQIARADGAFTIQTTMHNHHNVNKADNVGLTFDTVMNWDGSKGWVVDYDNPNNIRILREIEESVRIEAGEFIDTVQIGWGLLNENNFAKTGKPTHSLNGQMAFFEMMADVWNKKLQVSLGGSFGGHDGVPKAWTYLLYEQISATGWRWYSEFQDSYGRENWDSGYKIPYDIWKEAGNGVPIVSKREVTGRANQWNTHPKSRMSSEEAKREYVLYRYSFLNNMNHQLDYPDDTNPSDDEFIQQVMLYLPAQVAEYRETVGSVTNEIKPPTTTFPPSPPPSPDHTPQRVVVENGFIAFIETVRGESFDDAIGESDYVINSEHDARVYVLVSNTDGFTNWSINPVDFRLAPDYPQHVMVEMTPIWVPEDAPPEVQNINFHTRLRGDLITVTANRETVDLPTDSRLEERITDLEVFVIDELESLGREVVRNRALEDTRYREQENHRLEYIDHHHETGGPNER